jgi:hypothetical protein
MNYITRLSLALLALPCIHCQAPVAETEGSSAEPLTQVSWYLTGSATPTPVSGVSQSDIHVLGDKNSSDMAVDSVLWRERSDEPCYIAIGAEDVNDETVDSTPVKDHCGSKGPTSKTYHADYLDLNAKGGIGDHIFVRGVDACLNKAGDKLKGVSVAGLELASDGSLSYIDQVPDWANNCDHWAGWVTCGAGEIATAVDAHFAAGSEPRDMTGLGLECRKLEF